MHRHGGHDRRVQASIVQLQGGRQRRLVQLLEVQDVQLLDEQVARLGVERHVAHELEHQRHPPPRVRRGLLRNLREHQLLVGHRHPYLLEELLVEGLLRRRRRSPAQTRPVLPEDAGCTAGGRGRRRRRRRPSRGPAPAGPRRTLARPGGCPHEVGRPPATGRGVRCWAHRPLHARHEERLRGRRRKKRRRHAVPEHGARRRQPRRRPRGRRLSRVRARAPRRAAHGPRSGARGAR